MDRLLVMRSFVTVASVGSFSEAAKLLSVSGSLVSRHVADLEKQVGVRLVNRTARSISLTEPGRRYSEFAQRVLDEIDEQDQILSQMRDRPEGQLSIISPKWIGNLDLGEAIAEFSVAHPLIQVRYELGGMPDRTYDFLDSGFDVALHARPLRDSRVRMRKIASLSFVLCAAGRYIDEHGEPQHPNDIAEHDCLVHSNDPVWRIGQGRDSALFKPRRIAFLSNSYIALQKAAVHGRGIGLLPQRSVVDELNAGGLRVLLPDLSVPPRSLTAIYGPGEQTPQKVRVFLDFLTTWFVQHPMPNVDGVAAQGRRPA
jgi:DNA-binding transcriptional LysR family regulator